MSKKINVQDLADEIFDDVIKDFKSDIIHLEKMIEEQGNNDELLSGLTTVLRAHSERFSIHLVQRVVDEMQAQQEK